MSFSKMRFLGAASLSMLMAVWAGGSFAQNLCGGDEISRLRAYVTGNSWSFQRTFATTADSSTSYSDVTAFDPTDEVAAGLGDSEAGIAFHAGTEVQLVPPYRDRNPIDPGSRLNMWQRKPLGIDACIEVHDDGGTVPEFNYTYNDYNANSTAAILQVLNSGIGNARVYATGGIFSVDDEFTVTTGAAGIANKEIHVMHARASYYDATLPTASTSSAEARYSRTARPTAAQLDTTPNLAVRGIKASRQAGQNSGFTLHGIWAENTGAGHATVEAKHGIFQFGCEQNIDDLSTGSNGDSICHGQYGSVLRATADDGIATVTVLGSDITLNREHLGVQPDATKEGAAIWARTGGAWSSTSTRTQPQFGNATPISVAIERDVADTGSTLKTHSDYTHLIRADAQRNVTTVGTDVTATPNATSNLKANNIQVFVGSYNNANRPTLATTGKHSHVIYATRDATPVTVGDTEHLKYGRTGVTIQNAIITTADPTSYAIKLVRTGEDNLSALSQYRTNVAFLRGSTVAVPAGGTLVEVTGDKALIVLGALVIQANGAVDLTGDIKLSSGWDEVYIRGGHDGGDEPKGNSLAGSVTFGSSAVASHRNLLSVLGGMTGGVTGGSGSDVVMLDPEGVDEINLTSVNLGTGANTMLIAGSDNAHPPAITVSLSDGPASGADTDTLYFCDAPSSTGACNNILSGTINSAFDVTLDATGGNTWENIRFKLHPASRQRSVQFLGTSASAFTLADAEISDVKFKSDGVAGTSLAINTAYEIADSEDGTSGTVFELDVDPSAATWTHDTLSFGSSASAASGFATAPPVMLAAVPGATPVAPASSLKLNVVTAHASSGITGVKYLEANSQNVVSLGGYSWLPGMSTDSATSITTHFLERVFAIAVSAPSTANETLDEDRNFMTVSGAGEWSGTLTDSGASAENRITVGAGSKTSGAWTLQGTVTLRGEGEIAGNLTLGDGADTIGNFAAGAPAEDNSLRLTGDINLGGGANMVMAAAFGAAGAGNGISLTGGTGADTIVIPAGETSNVSALNLGGGSGANRVYVTGKRGGAGDTSITLSMKGASGADDRMFLCGEGRAADGTCGEDSSNGDYAFNVVLDNSGSEDVSLWEEVKVVNRASTAQSALTGKGSVLLSGPALNNMAVVADKGVVSVSGTHEIIDTTDGSSGTVFDVVVDASSPADTTNPLNGKWTAGRFHFTATAAKATGTGFLDAPAFRVREAYPVALPDRDSTDTYTIVTGASASSLASVTSANVKYIGTRTYAPFSGGSRDYITLSGYFMFFRKSIDASTTDHKIELLEQPPSVTVDAAENGSVDATEIAPVSGQDTAFVHIKGEMTNYTVAAGSLAAGTKAHISVGSSAVIPMVTGTDPKIDLSSGGKVTITGGGRFTSGAIKLGAAGDEIGNMEDWAFASENGLRLPSLELGGGDNKVKAVSAFSITAEGGNDTIELSGGITGGDAGTVSLGDGTNTLEIGGAWTAGSYTGGSGADTVTVSAAASVSLTSLNMGAGVNTLFVKGRAGAIGEETVTIPLGNGPLTAYTDSLHLCGEAIVSGACAALEEGGGGNAFKVTLDGTDGNNWETITVGNEPSFAQSEIKLMGSEEFTLQSPKLNNMRLAADGVAGTTIVIDGTYEIMDSATGAAGTVFELDVSGEAQTWAKDRVDFVSTASSGTRAGLSTVPVIRVVGITAPESTVRPIPSYRMAMATAHTSSGITGVKYLGLSPEGLLMINGLGWVPRSSTQNNLETFYLSPIVPVSVDETGNQAVILESADFNSLDITADGEWSGTLAIGATGSPDSTSPDNTILVAAGSTASGEWTLAVGRNTIIGAGTISGDVTLGAGNDVIGNFSAEAPASHNRLVFTGDLSLGAGDNMMRAAGLARVSAGGGDDTIILQAGETVGVESVNLGAGENTLYVTGKRGGTGGAAITLAMSGGPAGADSDTLRLCGERADLGESTCMADPGASDYAYNVILDEAGGSAWEAVEIRNEQSSVQSSLVIRGFGSTPLELAGPRFGNMAIQGDGAAGTRVTIAGEYGILDSATGASGTVLEIDVDPTAGAWRSDRIDFLEGAASAPGGQFATDLAIRLRATEGAPVEPAVGSEITFATAAAGSIAGVRHLGATARNIVTLGGYHWIGGSRTDSAGARTFYLAPVRIISIAEPSDETLALTSHVINEVTVTAQGEWSGDILGIDRDGSGGDPDNEIVVAAGATASGDWTLAHGETTIRGSGRISGDVTLGDGDDVVGNFAAGAPGSDNSLVMTGALSLGGGSNMVRAARLAKVTAGGGDDTVILSAGLETNLEEINLGAGENKLYVTGRRGRAGASPVTLSLSSGQVGGALSDTVYVCSEGIAGDGSCAADPASANYALNAILDASGPSGNTWETIRIGIEGSSVQSALAIKARAGTVLRLKDPLLSNLEIRGDGTGGTTLAIDGQYGILDSADGSSGTVFGLDLDPSLAKWSSDLLDFESTARLMAGSGFASAPAIRILESEARPPAEPEPGAFFTVARAHQDSGITGVKILGANAGGFIDLGGRRWKLTERDIPNGKEFDLTRVVDLEIEAPSQGNGILASRLTNDLKVTGAGVWSGNLGGSPGDPVNTISIAGDATATGDWILENGKTTITGGGTIEGSVTLGGGNDVVGESGGGLKMTGVLDLGDGDNTVHAAALSSVTAGAGDDTVILESGETADVGRINLGAGTNALYVAGGRGGAGATQITLSLSDGPVFGASSDTVYLCGEGIGASGCAVDPLNTDYAYRVVLKADGIRGNTWETVVISSEKSTVRSEVAFQGRQNSRLTLASPKLNYLRLEADAVAGTTITINGTYEIENRAEDGSGTVFELDVDASANAWRSDILKFGETAIKAESSNPADFSNVPVIQINETFPTVLPGDRSTNRLDIAEAHTSSDVRSVKILGEREYGSSKYVTVNGHFWEAKSETDSDTNLRKFYLELVPDSMVNSYGQDDSGTPPIAVTLSNSEPGFITLKGNLGSFTISEIQSTPGSEPPLNFSWGAILNTGDIDLSGASHTVLTGTGRHGEGTLTLGGGNDTIGNSSPWAPASENGLRLAKVVLGDGNNSLNAISAGAIEGGSGADTINLIEGASGAMSLGGGTNSVSAGEYLNIPSYTGGDGPDTISLRSSASTTSSIAIADMGAGTNRILISGRAAGAGAGEITLALNENSASGVTDKVLLCAGDIDKGACGKPGGSYAYRASVDGSLTISDSKWEIEVRNGESSEQSRITVKGGVTLSAPDFGNASVAGNPETASDVITVKGAYSMTQPVAEGSAAGQGGTFFTLDFDSHGAPGADRLVFAEGSSAAAGSIKAPVVRLNPLPVEGENPPQANSKVYIVDAHTTSGITGVSVIGANSGLLQINGVYWVLDSREVENSFTRHAMRVANVDQHAVVIGGDGDDFALADLVLQADNDANIVRISGETSVQQNHTWASGKISLGVGGSPDTVNEIILTGNKFLTKAGAQIEILSGHTTIRAEYDEASLAATVRLGDGNDTIGSFDETLGAQETGFDLGGSRIDLGGGDNRIMAREIGEIEAGDGNDTVIALGVQESTGIKLGNGANRLLIDARGISSGGAAEAASYGDCQLVDGQVVLDSDGRIACSGGDGDDTIIIGNGKGMTGHVYMGGGNNTLKGRGTAGGSATVYSDVTMLGGNDTIGNFGPGASDLEENSLALGNLSLGEGVNMVSAMSSGSIAAGDGDDTIMLAGGAAGAVSLGGGINTVTIGGDVTGGMDSMGTGTQKDTFSVAGSVGGEISMGGGVNVLDVKGSVTSGGDLPNGAGLSSSGSGSGDDRDSFTIGGSVEGAVNMGGGANFLHVMGGGVGGGLESSGTGTGDDGDSFTVFGDVGGEIRMGGGANTLHVRGSVTGGGLESEGAGIQADTFTIGGSVEGAIAMGGGVNVLSVGGRIGGGVAGGITMEGAGIGAGRDSITVAGDVAGEISMGAGANFLDVTGSVTEGGGLVSVGAGAGLADRDDFTVGGGVAGAVDMGGGTNTLNIGGSVGGGLASSGDGTGVDNRDDFTIGGDVGGAVQMGGGTNFLDVRGEVSGGGLDSAGDGTGVDGDTFIVGKGVAGKISMGGGDNRLEVGGSVTGGGLETAGTGAEKDMLTVAGGVGGAIVMGEGINVLSVGGDVEGGITSEGAGTGADRDAFDIGGSVGGPIDMGGGDNSLEVMGGVNGGIAMGSGVNGVDVGGSVAGGITSLSVGTGAGKDSFIIGGGVGGRDSQDNSLLLGVVDLAGGENELEVGGGWIGSYAGGDGNDTITLNTRGMETELGSIAPGGGENTLYVSPGAPGGGEMATLSLVGAAGTQDMLYICGEMATPQGCVDDPASAGHAFSLALDMVSASGRNGNSWETLRIMNLPSASQSSIMARGSLALDSPELYNLAILGDGVAGDTITITGSGYKITEATSAVSGTVFEVDLSAGATGWFADNVVFTEPPGGAEVQRVAPAIRIKSDPNATGVRVPDQQNGERRLKIFSAPIGSSVSEVNFLVSGEVRSLAESGRIDVNFFYWRFSRQESASDGMVSYFLEYVPAEVIDGDDLNVNLDSFENLVTVQGQVGPWSGSLTSGSQAVTGEIALSGDAIATGAWTLDHGVWQISGQGQVSGPLTLGGGHDRIGEAGDEIKNGLTLGNVNLGAGDNIVIAKEAMSIEAGSGDDSVTIETIGEDGGSAAKNGQVSLGDGENRLTVSTKWNSGSYTGGANRDVVTLAGEARGAVIDLGGGANELSAMEALSVTGGDGQDTVTIGTIGVAGQGGAPGQAGVVNLGGGANSLAVTKAWVDGEYTGRSGRDTIMVLGGGEDSNILMVNPGAGANEMYIAGSRSGENPEDKPGSVTMSLSEASGASDSLFICSEGAGARSCASDAAGANYAYSVILDATGASGNTWETIKVHNEPSQFESALTLRGDVALTAPVLENVRVASDGKAGDEASTTRVTGQYRIRGLEVGEDDDGNEVKVNGAVFELDFQPGESVTADRLVFDAAARPAPGFGGALYVDLKVLPEPTRDLAGGGTELVWTDEGASAVIAEISEDSGISRVEISGSDNRGRSRLDLGTFTMSSSVSDGVRTYIVSVTDIDHTITVGDPNNPRTAGDLNLGSGTNRVYIERITAVPWSGNYTGLGGVDFIRLSSDPANPVRATGERWNLGGGNNVVTGESGSEFTGSLILGDGDDWVGPELDGTGQVLTSGDIILGDISLGGGNNVVNIQRAGSITGGDEVDMVTLSSGALGDIDLMGGDKNELVAGGQIAGNVRSSAAGTRADDPDGDGNTVDNSDKFTVGSVSGFIDLGHGDNELTVRGSINGYYVSDGGNVSGGNGRDILTVQEDGSIDGVVHLGGGDKNEIKGSGKVTVELDLRATESVTIGVDPATNPGLASFNRLALSDVILGDGNNGIWARRAGAVTSGSGDDTVVLTEGASGSIDLKGGANTLTISGRVAGSYGGGDGDDVIKLEAGGSIAGMIDVGEGTNQIMGSPQPDTVSVEAGSGSINLGDGENTLELHGQWRSESMAYEGGDGKDTLKEGSGKTAWITGGIDLGGGNNDLALSLSKETKIAAGAGNDQIALRPNDQITLGQGEAFTITGIDLGGGVNRLWISGASGDPAQKTVNLSLGADSGSAAVGDDHLFVCSDGYEGDQSSRSCSGTPNQGVGDHAFSVILDGSKSNVWESVNIVNNPSPTRSILQINGGMALQSPGFNNIMVRSDGAQAGDQITINGTYTLKSEDPLHRAQVDESLLTGRDAFQRSGQTVFVLDAVTTHDSAERGDVYVSADWLSFPSDSAPSAVSATVPVIRVNALESSDLGGGQDFRNRPNVLIKVLEAHINSGVTGVRILGMDGGSITLGQDDWGLRTSSDGIVTSYSLIKKDIGSIVESFADCRPDSQNTCDYDFGDGINELTIKSKWGRSYTGGSGQDSLVVETGATAMNIDLEGGENDLRVMGRVGGNYSGGDGSDSITFQPGGRIEGDISVGGGENMIMGSDSADIVTLAGGGERSTADLRGGDNTVTIKTGWMGSYMGGDGRDMITSHTDIVGSVDLGGGDTDNDLTVVGDIRARVTSAATGTDRVSIQGGNGDISLGDGVNSLRVTGDWQGTYTGGSGIDSVILSSSVHIGRISDAIDLGGGDNRVFIEGVAGGSSNTVKLSLSDDFGAGSSLHLCNGVVDGAAGTCSASPAGNSSFDVELDARNPVTYSSVKIENPGSGLRSRLAILGDFELKDSNLGNLTVGSDGQAESTITVSSGYAFSPDTVFEIDVDTRTGKSDTLLFEGATSVAGYSRSVAVSLRPMLDISTVKAGAVEEVVKIDSASNLQGVSFRNSVGDIYVFMDDSIWLIENQTVSGVTTYGLQRLNFSVQAETSLGQHVLASSGAIASSSIARGSFRGGALFGVSQDDGGGSGGFPFWTSLTSGNESGQKRVGKSKSDFENTYWVINSGADFYTSSTPIGDISHSVLLQYGGIKSDGQGGNDLSSTLFGFGYSIEFRQISDAYAKISAVSTNISGDKAGAAQGENFELGGTTFMAEFGRGIEMSAGSLTAVDSRVTATPLVRISYSKFGDLSQKAGTSEGFEMASGDIGLKIGYEDSWVGATGEIGSRNLYGSLIMKRDFKDSFQFTPKDLDGRDLPPLVVESEKTWVEASVGWAWNVGSYTRSFIEVSSSSTTGGDTTGSRQSYSAGFDISW